MIGSLIRSTLHSAMTVGYHSNWFRLTMIVCEAKGRSWKRMITVHWQWYKMSAAQHGLFRQRSTSVHLLMHIRHPKLPRLSSPTYKARMGNAMVIHLEFIFASYQNLNLIIKSNVCLFPGIREMSGFEAADHGAYLPLQMLGMTSKPCLHNWDRRGFIIWCVCKKDFTTAIKCILNCLERADEIRLRHNGMLPGCRRLK